MRTLDFFNGSCDYKRRYTLNYQLKTSIIGPQFLFQYCQLNQNQPKSHFLFHKNVSLRDYNDFDSKCVWIFIFWRISVLIRSANDQSFLKQFLISQSDKIIFEVAFYLIFRRPQASENILVKLILRKYWNWCFVQFYQSRIEVLLNRSASFLSQLVILSQYL